MAFINIPKSAEVMRVVPKNAFHDYTNHKEKQSFTKLIKKITWQHKLSAETINLSGGDIEEIQVFDIELKIKQTIPDLLKVIDKAIPYPLIFSVRYGDQVYFSAAQKHPHPTNPKTSVIDWVFESDWQHRFDHNYQLDLRGSLDEIFKDFCVQLSGLPELSKLPVADIIFYKKQAEALEKEITKVRRALKGTRQYNRKVELNVELQAKEEELSDVLRRLGKENSKS